jgi:CheY-like chemotaxis protein
MSPYNTDKEFMGKYGPEVRCTPRRVLIVDDNDSVRRVFKRVLQFSLPECKTDLASNGAQAVRLFGLNHYAVILMDLRMPVLDGESAFRMIEEMCRARNWSEPSVVFCTGYIPSDNILDHIKANSRNCCLLHKPVDNRTLVASIKSRLVA